MCRGPESLDIKSSASLHKAPSSLREVLPAAIIDEVFINDAISSANLTSFVAPVIIEDGAWVSVGAIVLPGVRIGKNAVIGAGSVVIKDVPEAVFAAGMPAKPKVELKL